METPVNKLIHETSPYLLQHANNPVQWYAWNDESLNEAKKSGKLIVISIGYAACHWCHVMEHESFENEEVAEVMNTHFINIKVDREERPDVDQAYMNAVQIMTGSGGWPMNVIALPDGRPVWGGTYFKKDQWIKSLNQVANLYKTDPDTLYEYANKLEAGLKQMQLIPENESEQDFSKNDFKPILKKWKTRFDLEYGGDRRAPKFVIPSNFEFLLRYATQKNDTDLFDYVQHSLTKISFGGIYDHVEGGFSRYAVDDIWHVPHFEKMLYDNGQLMSLYSNAYASTNNSWFKELILQSLNFIENKLTNKTTGAFYASLDADSLNKDHQLEEGAFYVWSIGELKGHLKEDFNVFSSYYNINPFGKWEHDKYVLIRTKTDEEVALQFDMPLETLQQKKKNWLKILNEKREVRDKPRLDDKQITSWNALMLNGYVNAYKKLSQEKHLKTAIKNAHFIADNLIQKNGSLHHSYKGNSSKINGYLEDYALVIEAFLNLYEVSLDKKWLELSHSLIEYSIHHFYDPEQMLFYFTSNEDAPLITRNMEYNDNVIPSSNSVMGKNLFKLSKYFEESRYLDMAYGMLKKIDGQIASYPQGYSNWMELKMNFTHPYFEIVVVGENAFQIIQELNKLYLPNILIDGAVKEDNRPLTKNRYIQGKTLIYACINGSCQLPVTTIPDLLGIIQAFNKT
ncbi:thioredoxin domain-containing protein [Gillisia sp. M10.2A]|uniref:Thioredoxin domain-containing protein n=1 Tax=Gillisia lutea TaxID=2909668 RepID=A0ABS9EFC2_9FLAO|nr:thioredoxin domain-containing protein [Gillisia lutea]MCF4100156.1 thioredoxin domain-containing protein [Gillisia lutea]